MAGVMTMVPPPHLANIVLLDAEKSPLSAVVVVVVVVAFLFLRLSY